MTKKSPAFQFYPKDFLADTGMLSAEHVGAYMRLLCYAWKGVRGLPQGHLPANDAKLSRMAGMSREEWGEAKEDVIPFFEETEDGTIAHPRLLAELSKQKERRDSLSKRGKKGAEVRWGGGSDPGPNGGGGDGRSMAGPSPEHSNGHAPASAQAMPTDGPAVCSLQSATAVEGDNVLRVSNSPDSCRVDGAAGVEKSVENGEPPSRTKLRTEAEHLIRSELLLGSDVANAGGRRLELTDQLKGWDQMVRRGTDPETLNGAIRCLRSVLEGDLATKPVGLGLLRSRPALWNQATAAWLNSLPPPDIVAEVAGGMN